MMSGYNDDIRQRQIDKLAQLFPEVVTEGKIDWQKLRATLGEAVDLGERYGLGWKGKSDVFTTIQEKTVQTLHSDRANSVDWDTTGNMFIEGDNLAALKILHKAYYGKVKMIYIDPPYNTGNDFIYNDNFKQTRRSYETEAGITDDEGNVVRDDGLRTNTGGHKHSNWLNMMYPRLFLARNLLRQDGVIFVSIDDNEVHNLRLMMNEIFGEENFLGQMVWHARGRSKTLLSIDHEYVLVYVRQRGSLVSIVEAGSDAANWYGEPVERKYANPDNDPRGLWRDAQHTVTQKKAHYTYSINRHTGEIRDDVLNDGDWYGHNTWMYAPVTAQKLFSDNRLFFIKNGERLALKVKKFKREEESFTSLSGLVQRSDISSRHGSEEFDKLIGTGIFDYPKPTRLVKKLLGATTIADDIVLDFFSGSGTTAHAVAELNAEDGGNRRWICVQLPELTDEKSEAHKAGYRTIADIARERIRRAGAKIRTDQADKLVSRNAPLDLGFRAYRVDDSNFKQWNELVSDPEEIRQQALANLDPLEEGATDDDLLTELLLKRGISPLVQIDQYDDFCFIPSEKLVICLTRPMTEELFAIILATKPSSIILLDRAFGDDINLKVNLLLQAERQGVEVEVV